ncbi:hypothetical protein [Salinigranum sp. GCM10025319]|uniref:hypothetical protein n=1 Tax=Salinigranum sp. GCM10025319 TaxID=3252687 RepID=UPI003619CD0D
MAEAALFFVVLLVGVGGTLLLYLLIEGETAESETIDRDDAEAHARRRAAERYGGGGQDDSEYE